MQGGPWKTEWPGEAPSGGKLDLGEGEGQLFRCEARGGRENQAASTLTLVVVGCPRRS